MTTARITSVTSTETRAETIAAASAGALTLSVDEVYGFVEPGFVRVDDLTTGASGLYALTDVDRDNAVLTLGSALSAALPAGSVVVAVSATGQSLVDFYADVDYGDGATDRVGITAEAVRGLGRDLVGAGCEVDGEWVRGIFDVPEREVTPYARFIMGSNYSIPNGTAVNLVPQVWTPVPFVGVGGGVGIKYDGFTGNATVDRDGTYEVESAVTYAVNTTGARKLRVVWLTFTGALSSEHRTVTPTSTTWPADVARSWSARLAAGEGFRVETWQNSGGALNLLGGYDPPLTSLTATYRGP